MDDQDDLVSNFLGITGASESQALQLLEATGYNLQEAVELFFAAGGDLGAGPPAGAGAPLPAESNGEPEDDEALARRLQNEANAAAPLGGGGGGEEEVRAPLPSKVERLYGDFQQQPASRAARSHHNAIPTNALDAFRDFSGNQDSGAGGSSSGHNNRLASMFEPPRDLLFHGNFEEAKAYAASLGKWLIINLQSTTQFASHQLNRDTWRDSSVHALVESSFVLYQAYDVTDEGQKLCTYYQVYEVPSVLVLDPVTGAPMRHWTGFLSAERMAENLSPFLDTAFTDPGAARLAASMKRKQAGMSGAGAVVPSNGSGSGNDRSRGATPVADEDAELQAALEASMSGIAAATSGGRTSKEAPAAAPVAVPEPIPESPAQPAGPRPEDVAAEAAARLPEQPSGTEGCRIAVRFPDGGRQQRRFPRSAPLSCVHDWCLTVSMEAAGGRGFFLSEAAPGAPPLVDVDQSLEAAGVADAMLVMKWRD